MKTAESYILDTSVFTNPNIYRQFGADSIAAVEHFLPIAGGSPSRFYMPGSAYEELKQMKALGSLAAEFERIVTIRSPRTFQLQIPAHVLYEFIDEVRGRIDRGLRIAEEHTKLGHQSSDAVGPVINRLRDRYREALRRGIIDSREDVDVLLLAYELDGVLVCADEGLRKWADKVGVKILSPQYLKHVIENGFAAPASDEDQQGESPA